MLALEGTGTEGSRPEGFCSNDDVALAAEAVADTATSCSQLKLELSLLVLVALLCRSPHILALIILVASAKSRFCVALLLFIIHSIKRTLFSCQLSLNRKLFLEISESRTELLINVQI